MIKKSYCYALIVTVIFVCISISVLIAHRVFFVLNDEYPFLSFIGMALTFQAMVVTAVTMAWGLYIRHKILDEIHNAVDPVNTIVRHETGKPLAIDKFYIADYSASAGCRWYNRRVLPNCDMRTLDPALTLPLKIAFWLFMYAISAMITSGILQYIYENLTTTL